MAAGRGALQDGPPIVAALTLVLAFFLNLLPEWPLARSEDVAVALAGVLGVGSGHSIMFRRLAAADSLLANPWAVSLLLLNGPWISPQSVEPRVGWVEDWNIILVLCAVVAWAALTHHSGDPAVWGNHGKQGMRPSNGSVNSQSSDFRAGPRGLWPTSPLEPPRTANPISIDHDGHSARRSPFHLRIPARHDAQPPRARPRGDRLHSGRFRRRLYIAIACFHFYWAIPKLAWCSILAAGLPRWTTARIKSCHSGGIVAILWLSNRCRCRELSLPLASDGNAKGFSVV